MPTQSTSLIAPSDTATLSEWLGYIGSIHVSAIDMGLERVLPVATALGLSTPQLAGNHGKHPYVFTVAGTNGKGSTTATIASICQAAGLKTALYQSPHLVSFTERVRINGVEATDADLIRAFSAVESARTKLGLSLSFFEMTTLAAFWLFKAAECDVWVLEIGLGGRLDVVNIIDPDTAVITNIGIDHVDWLGSDIEKIGQEKAGIIRPDIPVVLGNESMPNTVHEIAGQASHVYQYGTDFSFSEYADHWIYSSAALTVKLPRPNLSIANAANAVSAIMASKLPINLDAVKEGLISVQLAGRFDRRTIADRSWIFDVAHNEDGIVFLLEQWAQAWRDHQAKFPQAKLKVLFSMLGDKDVPSVLKHVQSAVNDGRLPAFDWHMAAIDHERAMSSDALYTHLSHYTKTTHIHRYHDLAAATAGIIADSTADDLLMVFGSFHTIGEALIALMGRPY